MYRQPTRGSFCTVGTIVTIHRCGLRDRSSWTDRTMPKNFDPFKLSSAVRPLYWARRQRWASAELLVSTVCTMTFVGNGERRNRFCPKGAAMSHRLKTPTRFGLFSAVV